METPDQTNILFMDEYPHLEKKVWLRRLNEARNVGQLALFPQNYDNNQLVLFPERPDNEPA